MYIGPTSRYVQRISGRSCVDGKPLYSVYDTVMGQFLSYGIVHEDGSRSFSTRDLNEVHSSVQRMNKRHSGS
jgi:hypothetical protein